MLSASCTTVAAAHKRTHPTDPPAGSATPAAATGRAASRYFPPQHPAMQAH